MQTITHDKIIVPENRQRVGSKASKDLTELKRSITTKGLLHPPVLTSTFTLCAGERRLLACKELHTDGVEFKCNGEVVLLNEIPFTFIADLDPADLAEAELDENVWRLPLSWQEESAAKLYIANLRKSQDPTTTDKAVAQEIAEKKQTDPGTEQKELSMIKNIAPHMNDPDVKAAKSLSKAHAIVLDKKKNKLLRDLSRLQPSTTSGVNIIHGDCLEVMKTLTKGSFDVIISDPPYGISADKMGADTRHNYDDSKERALTVYKAILRSGFDLLKSQGAVFLFCDIEHFNAIRLLAEQVPYSTFRTPFIWHKGDEGYAPWGKNGFTRTYEIGLYAVKGQRPLILNPGPDVRLIRRSTKATKLHAAEKPPELFKWLLEASTTRGNSVLDPCCGSGPVIPVCKSLGLSLTAIELNEDYHAAAVARATEQEDVVSTVSRPDTLEDIDDDIFSQA